MMYHTAEYTVLKSKVGEADKVIKPFEKFEAFTGDYIACYFARVRDEDEKIVMEIQGGDNIKGVGEMPKPKPKKTSVSKE